ncbi:hypothetical protein AAP_00459 [Ascosphaera apis ARSEF 7405]|uniref:Uncharacterized protein n=1 Tax=Ascosphaera apis ARSEF 7405 TaxID=392613 RepID=A0A168DWN7_9EURO|nr:hypothetical protein AAP_00459 [Ascosphaera apis ARSEF 7405]
MSVSKSQADIIFDRANVALARSQKLVASWLPSNNEDDELSKRKTDAELQREEDEIFVAVPEKLGLGAPVPSKEADATARRSDLSSNEKLRQQLMGKNYKKLMALEKQNQKQHPDKKFANGKTTAANRMNEEGEDDDDDEPSRSSLGKKRKQVVVEKDDSGSAAPAPSRARRGGSYLDEVLAQRAKKKKKNSAKQADNH